jgi:hypothetical protein
VEETGLQLNNKLRKVLAVKSRKPDFQKEPPGSVVAKNKGLAYATFDSRTGSKIISRHENRLENTSLILVGHEFRKNCYLMLELTVEGRHSPSMTAKS